MSGCRRSSSHCTVSFGRDWSCFHSSIADGFRRSRRHSDGAADLPWRCLADCRSRCLSYLGYLFVPLGHGARHPAIMRRAGRHGAGAACSEGAFAGAPHRRRAGDGSRASASSAPKHCGPSAHTASAAISCSWRLEASSPPSACWCGCGGYRQCGRRRSRVSCRWSVCRSCCSDSTICWPRAFSKICCRR